MPEAFILPLFVVVAALYASVGHGGASGYIALFALSGAAGALIVPSALMLNVLVASIGFWQFRRVGHFRPSLLLPFAVASIPAAYVGGSLAVGRETIAVLLGIALLLSAWRIFVVRRKDVGVQPPRGGRLWLVAFPSGAALGLLSGLIGIGGGVFLSPLLLIARWADTRQTAAISSAFIVLNSLSGLAGQAQGGGVARIADTAVGLSPFAVAVLLGGVLGARAGARILPVRGVRVVLATVLVLAGGKLIASVMW